MKAFILAAGLGTRMRPFTNGHPKALVPVNGVPLILYTLAFLRRNGIREVVVNLHHHPRAIPLLLGDGRKIGLRIRYSREPRILGTGGGLRKALGMIRGESALVVNGDVVADFDLKALIALHRRRRPIVTMALYRHPEAERYGLIHYRGTRLVSLLANPPPPPHCPSAMYASFHVLSPPALRGRLKAFASREKFCLIRDVYIPEILADACFAAYRIRGFWRVCDSLSDVRAAEEALQRRRLSYAEELEKMAGILKIRVPPRG